MIGIYTGQRLTGDAALVSSAISHLLCTTCGNSIVSYMDCLHARWMGVAWREHRSIATSTAGLHKENLMMGVNGMISTLVCLGHWTKRKCAHHMRMEGVRNKRYPKLQYHLNRNTNLRTLCKIMSNGPCSERGRVSSIDTKWMPFFLNKCRKHSSRSIKGQVRAYWSYLHKNE